ncbi:MAG TPA: response regulator transcription factor, partial [Chloroflexota bacterium]
GVVLVLTANRDEAVARRLLQAGARGYLDKDCDLDDLVHAIERVRLGELVVGSVGAETVLKALGDESPREPRPEGLTEREIEVLRLVAQGRTNTQIAAELCITEHTVKAHLAKILGKLGLDNRVQLAAYAMQRGLASASSAAPDGSA